MQKNALFNVVPKFCQIRAEILPKMSRKVDVIRRSAALPTTNHRLASKPLNE
jgi:hypothetical protein